jgi:hypothetical protein
MPEVGDRLGDDGISVSNRSALGGCVTLTTISSRAWTAAASSNTRIKLRVLLSFDAAGGSPFQSSPNASAAVFAAARSAGVGT